MKHYSKLNTILKQHNKVSYPPQAQRHVAEQIDQLYWDAGERDVNMNGEEWSEKGADYRLSYNIEKLPEGWSEEAEVKAPEQAAKYRELQTKLLELNEKRRAAKERLEQYKSVKELVEPFDQADKNIQENLITKNGEIEKELERMRMLMLRVERGILSLRREQPGGLTGGVRITFYASSKARVDKFYILGLTKSNTIQRGITGNYPNAYTASITDPDENIIEAIYMKVLKAHPTLDCAFLSSGIQRSLDFTKPESIDLDLISTEFTTNYLSYVHLTKALLPHLQKRAQGGDNAGLVFTTSGLALVPITRCGNYCASKAAMHQLILVMREQLRAEGGGADTEEEATWGKWVTVIEIYPPAVRSFMTKNISRISRMEGILGLAE
ncbi:hypothetical protein DID88_009469 [Monilinia fructigena]|uniref:Uncharacterized protein n=1 Tax=Monilinia fructigena TaxID=38457 RepID=A0A395IPJ1_9HELO|nr:hypothetical protein DID88_009469 [Monilinia fructigena]